MTCELQQPPRVALASGQLMSNSRFHALQGVVAGVEPVGVDGPGAILFRQDIVAEAGDLPLGVEALLGRDAAEPTHGIQHGLDRRSPDDGEIELSPSGAVASAELGFVPLQSIDVL